MSAYLDFLGPAEWACLIWFAAEGVALIAVCVWLVWKIRRLHSGKSDVLMPSLEFFIWLLVMAAASGLLWRYFMQHLQNLPHHTAPGNGYSRYESRR